MTANEAQYLYLITTGWKSGNPHRIEIWYVEYKGCYYLISEMREQAHWVQNIQRNPKVTFTIAERALEGKGRVIDPAVDSSLAAAVSALMDEKYSWSDGLLVELKPDSQPTL